MRSGKLCECHYAPLKQKLPSGPFLAGGLNDLFSFNPDSLEWAYLTGTAVGSAPAPRAGLGMASVPGGIFVFGGVKPVQGGEIHVLRPSTITRTVLLN